MSIKPEVRRLEATIRDLLAGGSKLNPAAQHYIDSTFSNPTVEQLDLILKNEGLADGDSLLELLIAPDETFQLELERTLSAHPLAEEDAEQLAALLDDPATAMVLSFPDGRGPMRIDLTPTLVRCFLSHLKLTWRPHPTLAVALEAAGSTEQGGRLRIRLRNCRVDWSEEKASFMGRLLQSAASGNDCDMGWIDFALEFLSDTPAGADISRALEHRKRMLVKALHQSRRQRELLESANIESLVSRGLRLAHIDEIASRLQVAHIDRISLAVYGRTWPVPEADEVVCDAGNAFDLTRRFC
jgi:hypothetical protein